METDPVETDPVETDPIETDPLFGIPPIVYKQAFLEHAHTCSKTPRYEEVDKEACNVAYLCVSENIHCA